MKASLTNKCIGFIGVGVMGSSLIKSLLVSSVNSEQICISDKSSERTAEVSSAYKVKVKTITEIGKDCDVIFLDDVSVMFDKYKEVFYGLYEGTSELMGKLIGTKNAMCSGQFFFKRELLLDIPIFFQKIMEKSKHLCDTINTTLDNHKDIPWIKTLMEQYAGHRVLMDYNILINPMHTSDIKFGSTTCDIEVLENDEIKIINSTTKIIHYTNNNAFIFVPKKYRNEDLNLLFKNNIVNKQLNRPLWG